MNGVVPMNAAARADVPAGYSRYMRRDLAQRYLETTRDPELLSLQNDVSLITERINGLLERVQTGESAGAWKQIARCWKDHQRFRASGHTTRAAEALDSLIAPLE